MLSSNKPAASKHSTSASPPAKYFYEAVVQPYKGATLDKVVMAAHLATLNDKLDVYDKILSKQQYLAGDVSADIELVAN